MKNYWTKCGIEFQKSTNAETTGYRIEIVNSKCSICPFTLEVTKGYPAVFDHWECRAGSEKPNHNNDYRGCMEDKTNLKILSLDMNFLYEVIKFVKTNVGFIGYQFLHDNSDCRKILSVYIEQNKNGIAAKQDLVKKFFKEGIHDD